MAAWPLTWAMQSSALCMSCMLKQEFMGVGAQLWVCPETEETLVDKSSGKDLIINGLVLAGTARHPVVLHVMRVTVPFEVFWGVDGRGTGSCWRVDVLLQTLQADSGYMLKRFSMQVAPGKRQIILGCYFEYKKRPIQAA